MRKAKILLLFFTSCFLPSCSTDAGPAGFTVTPIFRPSATERSNPTPTHSSPTPSSIPIHNTATPSGVPDSERWISYLSDDFRAMFEYPEVYESGACGHLETWEREEDSELGFAGDLVIGFEGGTITIAMTNPWMGDFNEYVESLLWRYYYADPAERSEIMVDGYPAVSLFRVFERPAATQSDQLVLLVHNDRLYKFRYAVMNWIWCDAESISEYGIFQHILSSWHFSD